MSTGIKIKVDVSKIRKESLFKGAKGTYMDCVLWENDQPDEYGNTHCLVQDLGKDARERGEKGPYIGNGSWLQARGQGGGNQRQQPRQGQQQQRSQGRSGPRNGIPPKPQADEWGDDSSQVPF